MRVLAFLALLPCLSGCAVGAAGVAADLLAGVSLASMTVSGKGLGDQAISAAAGKDCRVLEGMMRSDRGICEDYKTAVAQRVLIETPPPAMPEILVGQPFQAQPAIARLAIPTPRVALARPAEPPPTEKRVADAQTKEKPAAAEAAKQDTQAAASEAKPPSPPAVVMENEDSLKLAFGGGRSDGEVMTQLHAAIAAWRETDKPLPAPAPPAEQAAPAQPAAEAAPPAR